MFHTLTVLGRFFLNYHNFLTLKLLETCMSFFLLLNKKEDHLKNMGNQTVNGT